MQWEKTGVAVFQYSSTSEIDLDTSIPVAQPTIDPYPHFMRRVRLATLLYAKSLS